MDETDLEKAGSLWKMAQLRFTVFPLTPPESEGNAWWANAVGNAPENTILTPHQRERRDEGPFPGGSLVLSIRPQRVDWLLPVGAPAPAEFINAPAYSETLPPFEALVRAWTSAHCPPVQRAALGAILMHPVPTPRDGNRLLMQMVPGLRLDGYDVSDAVFEVNRPIVSARYTSPLKINRLMKWSVITFQSFEIVLPTPSLTQTRSDVAVCRLELDINTDSQLSGSLDSKHLVPVVDELIQLATTIAAQGDPQ